MVRRQSTNEGYQDTCEHHLTPESGAGGPQPSCSMKKKGWIGTRTRDFSSVQFRPSEHFETAEDTMLLVKSIIKTCKRLIGTWYHSYHHLDPGHQISKVIRGPTCFPLVFYMIHCWQIAVQLISEPATMKNMSPSHEKHKVSMTEGSACACACLHSSCRGAYGK